MEMLSRRTLLSRGTAVCALAVGGGVLAGCGTIAIPSIPVQTWVSGIQAIGTELAALLPNIAGAANIPAATVATISQVINEIEQVASGVGVASTASQGQAVLQQIEAYINTLAPLITPFLSLIPGGAIIGVIVASLPAIEAAVGIVISLLTPATVALSPVPASRRLRGSAAPSLAVSQQYLSILIADARRK